MSSVSIGEGPKMRFARVLTQSGDKVHLSKRAAKILDLQTLCGRRAVIPHQGESLGLELCKVCEERRGAYKDT